MGYPGPWDGAGDVKSSYLVVTRDTRSCGVAAIEG
jgi:hypothetical protein